MDGALKYIVSSLSASGFIGSQENQSFKGAGSSVSGSSGCGSGLSGGTTGSSPQEKKRIEISSIVSAVLTVLAV